MRNVSGCCILASTLRSGACGMVTGMLHFSGNAWKECSCWPFVPSSTTVPYLQHVLFIETFTSFCQTYDGTMDSKLPSTVTCLRTLRRSALFCPSCAPARPRGSLLDVSRLELTLRPSALVCCCHRDSDTLEAGPCAERAALVVSFSSREAHCASTFLTACEECPRKRFVSRVCL